MFDKVENLKELFKAYRKLYRSKEKLSSKEKEANEILFSMLGEFKEIFEFTMNLKKQHRKREEGEGEKEKKKQKVIFIWIILLGLIENNLNVEINRNQSSYY